MSETWAEYGIVWEDGDEDLHGRIDASEMERDLKYLLGDIAYSERAGTGTGKIVRRTVTVTASDWEEFDLEKEVDCG